MDVDLTIRISIEELALAFVLNGQSESANALLTGSLERELSQDEAIGRLAAAGHTLLGKGLVELSADGNVVSSPILTEIVHVMTAARYTLRYSLSSPEGQRALSYHFADNGIYEHWLDEGVIHVITRVNVEELVTACALFFELESYQPTPDAAGVLAEPLFRQALRQKQAMDAETLLRGALPEALCRPLSEDAAHTKAIGDVLWIRYQENREPVSDEGFLMVFGAERFWLFEPVQRDNGEAKIRLLPGTIDALQQGVRQIVSKYI
ncbi:hypothetical protein [Roseiflexus sp.]|uniref:hypothetical protein n=1 Tax=Roseiflexus sp. TaxID=2562120 RepID=UPI00398B2E0A